MKIKTKRKFIKEFKAALNRAKTLYALFVTNGVYQKAPGKYAPLRTPDRRDAAAFIFIEASSKFEAFCYQAFLYDSCDRYGIKAKTAEFIIGSSDKGTESTFGWTTPKTLNSRGGNLLTKKSIFGNLKSNLGELLYDRLGEAHEIRNRIAHPPATANSTISKFAIKLGVPAKNTKFLSVGRLLMDYPSANLATERYFHIYLKAYFDFVTKYQNY
jgi:hypothetical protein